MSGNGNAFFTLFTGKSIAAGATYNLDLDLATVYKNLKLIFGVNYTVLGAGSLTLTVFSGYGNGDVLSTSGPVPYVDGATGSLIPVFTTAGSVQAMTAPVAGQTIWTDLLLQTNPALDKLPRWVRLQFINTDTNPCKLTVSGDL